MDGNATGTGKASWSNLESRSHFLFLVKPSTRTLQTTGSRRSSVFTLNQPSGDRESVENSWWTRSSS